MHIHATTAICGEPIIASNSRGGAFLLEVNSKPIKRYFLEVLIKLPRFNCSIGDTCLLDSINLNLGISKIKLKK